MSSHPVDEYVGNRLQLLRTVIGMSQQQLGKAVGVSFQQIQKYEKGSNRISCSRLYEISAILKKPVTFFFEGIDQILSLNINPVNELRESEQTDFEIEEKTNNKELLSLVRSFNSIKDASVKKSIVSLVKSLCD